MAESKRQSAAGKVPVATPIVGQGQGNNLAPLMTLESALIASIGAKIRLTTVSPSSTIEGTLFTACPLTNLIVVQLPPSTNHIVPISSVHSFNILSLIENSLTAPTQTSSSALPPVPPLPATETLLARANTTVERLKAEAAKKNRNVSKEAQDIFDAMLRMYANTRWDGDKMVVAESVIIEKPYRTENCSAIGSPSTQPEGVRRIKKVLENERRKLAERTKVAVPAVPAVPQVPIGGPRKGG